MAAFRVFLDTVKAFNGPPLPYPRDNPLLPSGASLYEISTRFFSNFTDTVGSIDILYILLQTSS